MAKKSWKKHERRRGCGNCPVLGLEATLHWFATNLPPGASRRQAHADGGDDFDHRRHLAGAIQRDQAGRFASRKLQTFADTTARLRDEMARGQL